MNPSDYQQEFDKIIARKYFDKTLEKTRKEAFSKFLNLGIPTKKWENWRHTDLSLINKQNFRISEKHDASCFSDILKFCLLIKDKSVCLQFSHFFVGIPRFKNLEKASFLVFSKVLSKYLRAIILSNSC